MLLCKSLNAFKEDIIMKLDYDQISEIVEAAANFIAALIKSRRS